MSGRSLKYTSGYAVLGMPGPGEPLSSNQCPLPFEIRTSIPPKFRKKLQQAIKDSPYTHQQLADWLRISRELFRTCLYSEDRDYKVGDLRALATRVGVPIPEGEVRNYRVQLDWEYY